MGFTVFNNTLIDQLVDSLNFSTAPLVIKIVFKKLITFRINCNTILIKVICYWNVKSLILKKPGFGR